MALKRKLSQEFDDAAYVVGVPPLSHYNVNFVLPYLVLTLFVPSRWSVPTQRKCRCRSCTRRSCSLLRTLTWTSTCRTRRAPNLPLSTSRTTHSTPDSPPTPARPALTSSPRVPPVSLTSSVRISCIEWYVVASYPAFDLYPHNPTTMSVDAADYFDHVASSSPRMVGLMQPKGSGFTHHG